MNLEILALRDLLAHVDLLDPLARMGNLDQKVQLDPLVMTANVDVKDLRVREENLVQKVKLVQ